MLAVAAAVAMGAAGAREMMRPFDAAAWGRMLETRLRETTAALHARVATLAELPRLAAAVATDAQTVRDLTQDELAFRLRRGEAIAIGQLPKTGTKTGTKTDKPGDGPGAPVLLLAFPDQAHAPPLYPLAVQVRIDEGTLVATEAIKVVPRDRADEIDGVVAAGLVVELDDFSKRLRAAGIGARISLGGHELDVALSEPTGDVEHFELPVSGPAGVELQLALSAPARDGGAPYFGGAGAFGLVALLFAFRARRGARGLVDLPANAPTNSPAALPTSLPTNLPEVWAPDAAATSRSGRFVTGQTTVVVGEAGRMIGRYQIIQLIGSGGMSDVFLAHATGEAGFAKRIALKVLSADFAAQPHLVEQFLDEARLAAQLDHPNIVQIIDLGHADGAYFIAMEYVDGADLRLLVDLCHRQGRPISPGLVIAILRKICDGLHAAHTACGSDGAPLGLIHRDVKSGNVFVARSGAVKVGDFGIALASHASRLTRTERGQVKGTPGYMAPEHRMGLPIDGRADLYGVGAIGYELLSGVPVNLDFMLVSRKGQDGWPHLGPLSRFRNDVPAELEAVIFQTLSYEPGHRFPDGAALELALEDVAKRHPPIAGGKDIARWIDATLAAGSPRKSAGTPPQAQGQDG